MSDFVDINNLILLNCRHLVWETGKNKHQTAFSVECTHTQPHTEGCVSPNSDVETKPPRWWGEEMGAGRWLGPGRGASRKRAVPLWKGPHRAPSLPTCWGPSKQTAIRAAGRQASPGAKSDSPLILDVWPSELERETPVSTRPLVSGSLVTAALSDVAWYLFSSGDGISFLSPCIWFVLVTCCPQDDSGRDSVGIPCLHGTYPSARLWGFPTPPWQDPWLGFLRTGKLVGREGLWTPGTHLRAWGRGSPTPVVLRGCMHQGQRRGPRALGTTLAGLRWVWNLHFWEDPLWCPQGSFRVPPREPPP